MKILKRTSVMSASEFDTSEKEIIKTIKAYLGEYQPNVSITTDNNGNMVAVIERWYSDYSGSSTLFPWTCEVYVKDDGTPVYTLQVSNKLNSEITYYDVKDLQESGQMLYQLFRIPWNEII